MKPSNEKKPISGRLLMELADVWENEGEGAQHAERRAAFREAADTLRTLLCTDCGAFWMEWSTSWSLCSKECGPCCDNSPDFVSKLAPLVVSDIFKPAEQEDG